MTPQLGNRVSITRSAPNRDNFNGEAGVILDIDRGYREAAVKLDSQPYHLWFDFTEFEVIGHDPTAMVYRGNRQEPAGPARATDLTPRHG